MDSIMTFILFMYFVGIPASIHTMRDRIDRKFPKLEYTWQIEFLIFFISLFSWLGLYFIVTNKDLNE